MNPSSLHIKHTIVRRRCAAFLFTTLLLAITGIFCESAHAAVKEAWVRTNGPGGNFISAAMTLNRDSNVYVTGTSADDFLTIKYSASGVQLWAEKYGDSLLDSAGAIAVDTEGNLWVVGVSSTNRVEGNITIIKYRSDGSRLWARRSNELINDSPYGIAGNASERIKMEVDPMGNAYVVANAGPSGEYLITKFSADGNEVWIRRYAAPPGYFGSVRGIALDATGNIVVAGSANAANGVSKFITFKYDPAGNFQWAAVDDWEGTSNFVTDMVVDPVGNVYLTGASWLGKHRFLTVKYSPDGETLWVAARPPANGRSAIARDLAVDAEGNVIVTGDENWEWNEDEDIYEVLTVKYDAAGNEVWSARSAVNNRRIAQALALDTEGNIYVGACDRCDSARRMLLLKYTPMGSQLWEMFVPSLTLRGLEVDGGGSLFVIDHSYGGIGGSVRKYVQTPLPSQPVALVEPSRAQVVQGSNVTFSAVVSGPGPFTYQWKRFGFRLPGQTWSTLSITNAQLAQQGDYTVIVSNEVGFTISPEARLFIGNPVALSAQRQGNALFLSWPTNAVEFSLQSTADLIPPATWVDVTNPPALLGAHWAVTNNFSGNAKFYRLRRQ